MDAPGVVPLLVSAEVQERIAKGGRGAELFFGAENLHVRRSYARSGDPKLALLMGRSVADLGDRLQVTGCAALAGLHLFLSEMCLAVSGSAADLARAGFHLTRARQQAEHARSDLAAPILLNWHWLMSVRAKVGGSPEESRRYLAEGVADRWIAERASPADYVAVVRQQVMMSQDLRSHLVLLAEARSYRNERPLEYYRTVKRVMEFLTNDGRSAAAHELHREFVRSFAVVRSRSTLISRISFMKNIAHLAALRGEVEQGRVLASRALDLARGAGLAGQQRQLSSLLEAIGQNDVRGALTTLRL